MVQPAQVPAAAPLEVASAGKPMPPSTRAEPPSQALAITKVPPSCSSRKRVARDF